MFSARQLAAAGGWLGLELYQSGLWTDRLLSKAFLDLQSHGYSPSGNGAAAGVAGGKRRLVLLPLLPPRATFNPASSASKGSRDSATAVKQSPAASLVSVNAPVQLLGQLVLRVWWAQPPRGGSHSSWLLQPPWAAHLQSPGIEPAEAAAAASAAGETIV